MCVHIFLCYFLSLRFGIEIAQWTFKNNGNNFAPEDWARLKKIGMLLTFQHMVPFMQRDKSSLG